MADTAAPGEESSVGAVHVGGKWLEPRPWSTFAWSGAASVRETMWVDTLMLPKAIPNADGTTTSVDVIAIEGVRWAFTPGEGTPIVLSVSSSTWRDPIQSALGTELALLVYHRPEGSKFEWLPVACNAYEEGRAPANDALAYYPSGVEVDVSRRLVTARAPVTTSMPFELCGIDEPSPEIAAMVLPGDVSRWFALGGSYDYDLSATCGDAPCGAYRDVLRAEDESWGRAGVPWIGIGFEAVPGELAAWLGLRSGQGARVKSVRAGGPAARAGLQAGDIVTTFDGQGVRFSELASTIQAAGAGHVAQVGVARRASDGRVSSLNVFVTIEMKPDAL